MGVWRKVKEAVPSYVWYILGLVLSTRIVLTIIAILARFLFSPDLAKAHGTGFASHLYLFLDVWHTWDSGWYNSIAAHGYSTAVGGQQNYNFFPLYPTMMKLFASVTGGDYYLAGFIVSNIALVVACIYLYKLVLLDSDDATALRTIKYLIVFPTAFYFSCVLSEGLFVMLAVMCFYYARRSQWLAAGVIGFFLTLDRSPGVLIGIPLAYLYMKERQFSVKKIGPDVLSLLLIPFAMLQWMLFNYRLVGDPLAFIHMQQTGWHHHLTNPWLTIKWTFLAGDATHIVWALYVLIAILLLCVFWKRIGFTYWLYSVLLIALPFSQDLMGMERYIAVVFPLYILFAKVSHRKRVDTVLTICLALFQGLFMVFWATHMWVAS